MDKSFARLLSIAGHPAVLMSVAAVIASPWHMGPAALAVSFACAALVLGYSLFKVRRGEWVHIDASAPAERAEFNSRVAVGLLALAAVLWFTGLHAGFPLVVGLSGLIIAVGHLFRGVAKLSLHAAFAVFAALLVWPNHIATAVLAVAAIAVCWSRLALRRHVIADIILGALVGAFSGLALHAVIAWLAA